MKAMTQLFLKVRFGLSLVVLVSGPGCATNVDPRVSDLKGYSELSESKTVRATEATGQKNPELKTVKDRHTVQLFLSQNPVLMNTTGQAKADVLVQKPVCLTHEGLEHLSELLDKAVLRVPDAAREKRIGLDPTVFTNLKLSFLVFKDAQASRVAQAAYRRDIDLAGGGSRKLLEPIIFVGCPDLNNFDGNVVREYARLYFNRSWSPVVRDAFATYVGVVAELPAHVVDQVPAKQFHIDAKTTLARLKNQRLLRSVGVQGGVGVPLKLEEAHQFEQLNASFIAYLVQRFGFEKTKAVVLSHSRVKDPYLMHLGLGLNHVRNAWLRDLYGRAGYIQLTATSN